MRKEAIKEKNVAISNQLQDKRQLLIQLTDINSLEARMALHGSDGDHAEWEAKANKILELEERINTSKITILRLNNVIINCARHMEMVQHM